jgi:hypothetical protein
MGYKIQIGQPSGDGGWDWHDVEEGNSSVRIYKNRQQAEQALNLMSSFAPRNCCFRILERKH